MTLARPFLRSTRSASVYGLTSAPAGGWTQIPAPKGVEFNGVIYFGYVNGTNGNIEIRTYTISSGVTSAATVLHAALQQDTHAAPAVIVLPSGKIVVAYCAHNDVTHLYVWVSANPEDISAGTETNIDSSFGSDTYTYCNLVYLSSESKLYLFVRSNTSTESYLQFSTSTDGGATWAAHTDLYVETHNLSYWKIASNGADRIDFTVSSDSGAPVGLGSLYHWYYDGTWRKSDGTSMGSPTFGLADLTLAYDGSTHPAWSTDIITNGGLPRIVYMTSLSSNADGAWGYARWTGSAWANVTVVASIGYGVVDPSPVAAIDAQLPSRLYMVRYIGGQHQVWRYTTSDAGATWDAGVAIATTGGANIYPTAVANHTTGPAVMWLFGAYTADTSNSMGIAAISG